MSDRADQPSTPPPGGGLLMGRPFGVPVYVSPTWFVVAALITWLFAPVVEDQLPGIGVARYPVALAFAVLLYLSVLVHELSHSVVAMRLGLPVRRITLHLLGGVSEIEREAPTPGREFLVAAAGPALSLVLAVVSWLLALPLPPDTVVWLLAVELAVANLLVGVFNLLPGLPLDGGRMLRAAVWKVTGRALTGSRAAGWAGRALAVLLVAVPVVASAGSGETTSLVNVVWLALLAAFIWVGATQAIRAAEIRERLPRIWVRDLTRRALPVLADLPLAEAVRRAREAGAGALVVVDPDGRPTGLVSEAAVVATPETRRPWVSVGALARSLTPGLVVTADLDGQGLVDALRARPAGEYLVLEPSGEVFGVLVATDAHRALAGTSPAP